MESNIMQIVEQFKKDCPCGMKHETAVKDIRIGSGLVHKVGDILKENGFSKNLLLVADQNTIKAADGIVESLKDFTVEYMIFDKLRVAEMKHVEQIEDKVRGKDISILSVGTGSINDPCRLAAARQDKLLCIFGTAPSMDGFASYGAPIVANGFKASYDAKSPEVVIGDTKILAAAPTELKSAGFGDMIAKYVGLVDWKISTILTGEIYCDRVADLTRSAVDDLMELADKVTVNDEKTAGMIFEALLKTGLGMSFMKNSRPASGSEHIISHLIECVELQDGIIPNYHGEDIGVCTLYMLKYLNELAAKKPSAVHKDIVDWDDVYKFYGPMAGDVKKLNTPDTIVDSIDPEDIIKKWDDICDAIHSVPDYETCLAAMKKAGCKTTVAEIGKSQKLFDDCVHYSPFMRRRMTMLRLKGMIEF